MNSTSLLKLKQRERSRKTDLPSIKPWKTLQKPTIELREATHPKETENVLVMTDFNIKKQHLQIKIRVRKINVNVLIGD
jgi:hypothetical protein